MASYIAETSGAGKGSPSEGTKYHARSEADWIYVIFMACSCPSFVVVI